MENLVKIEDLSTLIINRNDGFMVDGRQLHMKLEIGTEYMKWVKRYFQDYGFVSGEDYSSVLTNRCDGKAGKPQTNHYLTVDMAKEICMIQRSDIGKSIRKYFIECEKKLKQQPSLPDFNNPAEAARAWADQYEKNQKLLAENTVMKPKAEYFDCLVDRNLLTNFRTTAKEFHIKQKQFINWLLEKKFIYRDQKGNLQPYSQHADYFHVKDSKSQTGKWAGTQTLITPKGKEAFRLLLGKD